MDREKLRKKVEAQTSKDNSARRRFTQWRHLRIEKTMNEPLLPKFCRACYLCMLLATVLMASHDVYVFYAYPHTYGISRMLSNAASSAFFTWLVFAIMLVPCCIVQIRHGFSDSYFEKYKIPKRGNPQEPLEKRYLRWCVTAIAGLIAFGVLYFIFRI